MNHPGVTLQELAALVGASLEGGADRQVSRVAPLADAGPDSVSFLSNSRYRPLLARTDAGAVLVRDEDRPYCPTAALVCRDPYLAYALVAQRLAPPPRYSAGVDKMAYVHPEAVLGDGVSIGPHATVEEGAKLGDGVRVGPGCVVGADSQLGPGTELVANVTIGTGCRLGARVLVHPGAVIGADGFGFANDRGRWVKIPQTGGVVIGDDVEIGANTTIDRGALGNTVVEEGVKLDNQIQVAHNVHIGAHTAIAGQAGIAGSTRIGRHCTIGGGVGIAGHLEIADRVHLTGMTLVTNSIKESGSYSSGTQFGPSRQWRKNAVRFSQLDDIARRLRAVERELESRATGHDGENE